MVETLRCALIGYGRMGRAIEAELLSRGHQVVARLDSSRSPAGLSPRELDVAFEFTSPTSAPGLLTRLAERGITTVSGTTGYDGVEGLEQLFDDAQVRFLHAPNFSLGVHLLFRLGEVAGGALRNLPGFDAAIVERHHTRKKDAPSGTARELARRVEAASGRPLEVVALRQGGQPGEHRLVIEGEEETLEICHRARSPRLFAAGAVAAAEWLVGSGRNGHVPFQDFLHALFEEESS